jgi:uncharacterized delta-60 repeat protein
MVNPLRGLGTVGSLVLLLSRVAVAAPVLDPGFGMDGVVITNVGANSPFVVDLAVQMDGRIIVTGSVFGIDSLMLRYLPDGSPDPAFGTGGRVTTPLLRRFGAVAVQSDGRIVTWGMVEATGSPVLARYDPDGTLDGSFGVAGIAPTPEQYWLADLILLPDGKILGVGGTGVSASVLIRLLPDGALDASFGTGGIARHDLDAGREGLSVGALQADGKIVAAGFAGETAVVVRYDSDGTIDRSFGSGGVATGPAGYFSALLLESDGRVVCAGPPGLVRFDATGARDTSFGGGGVVSSPAGELSVLARSTDGKYLVAGTTGVPGFPKDDVIFVTRYTTDGVRDSTYGTSGVFRLPEHVGLTAADMAVQANGKVIVLSSRGWPANEVTLARLGAPICGDGVVEPDEPCDDGNLQNGDGCDASCFIEACHRCEGNPSVCSVGPRPSCTATMRPDRSSLFIVDAALDGGDKLRWKWKEGQTVNAGDLGDPSDLDGQHLCLFDGAGSVVAALDLGGGRTCGARPCWSVKPTRVSYADRTAAQDGVQRMTFRFGSAGRLAQLSFKAQGGALPTPALPVSLPLTVELQRPTGQCWAATYTSATVTANDTRRFQGVAAY